MRLLGTYIITLTLIALLGLFVWGWYSNERAIPDFVFSGLLGLIGTIVGYIWLQGRPKP